jgi:hypothetical protein
LENAGKCRKALACATASRIRVARIATADILAPSFLLIEVPGRDLTRYRSQSHLSSFPLSGFRGWMASAAEHGEEELRVEVDPSVYDRSSMQQSKKRSRHGTHEMLRYSFKPPSVEKQAGVLWKQQERSEHTKVFVEFRAEESNDIAGGGKSPNRAEPMHIFEGTMQPEKADDCVLIVHSSGSAQLYRITASALAPLKKMNNGTVPSVRPSPITGRGDSVGSAAAASPTCSSDADSDDSDDSDSGQSAQSSPGLTAVGGGGGGGGGKGLVSSGGKFPTGGKGVMTLQQRSAGGKGVMTLQQAQLAGSPYSSSDDDSDEDSD